MATLDAMITAARPTLVVGDVLDSGLALWKVTAVRDDARYGQMVTMENGAGAIRTKARFMCPPKVGRSIPW